MWHSSLLGKLWKTKYCEYGPEYCTYGRKSFIQLAPGAFSGKLIVQKRITKFDVQMHFKQKQRLPAIVYLQVEIMSDGLWDVPVGHFEVERGRRLWEDVFAADKTPHLTDQFWNGTEIIFFKLSGNFSRKFLRSLITATTLIQTTFSITINHLRQSA